MSVGLLQKQCNIADKVMKPRLNIFSLCLAVTFVSYTIGVPLDEHINRARRDLCAENDDRCIEDSYWKEVLPLGFFLNGKAAGGGDGGNVVTKVGNKRGFDNQGPLSNGGSGSGSHVTRSDIPGPKPATATAVQAPVANLVAETPLTQTVSSSTEQAPKKTVFCQGEKEWLQCPMYRVLKIKKAFWGRSDTTTCSDRAVTRTLKSDKLCAQDEANTMKKVETMCNDEEACELVASDTFFDRADCPDVYKYVELEYECLHREMRVKDTTDKSS